MALRRCLRLPCALSAAVVYFLASSNLAAFAINTIILQYKTSAPKSFSCAGHGCGCDLAKQAGKSCCCFPKRVQSKVCPLPTDILGHCEKETARITSLSVAQCKGYVTDDGVLLVSLQPHLGVSLSNAPDKFPTQRICLISEDMKYDIARQPPEKVPL